MGTSPQSEQIPNPFGSLGIVLVPFDSLDSFEVGDGDVDVVFKKIEHRHQYLPVDSMQISRQELSSSHFLKSRIELLNVEKRFL